MSLAYWAWTCAGYALGAVFCWFVLGPFLRKRGLLRCWMTWRRS